MAKPSLLKILFGGLNLLNSLYRFPGRAESLTGFLFCCPWWPVPAVLPFYRWPSADGSGSIRGEGSKSDGLMTLWLTWCCLMCCRYALSVSPVSLSSLCSYVDSFSTSLLSQLYSTRSFSVRIFAFVSWILFAICTAIHPLYVRKGFMNVIIHL